MRWLLAASSAPGRHRAAGEHPCARAVDRRDASEACQCPSSRRAAQETAASCNVRTSPGGTDTGPRGTRASPEGRSMRAPTAPPLVTDTAPGTGDNGVAARVAAQRIHSQARACECAPETPTSASELHAVDVLARCQPAPESTATPILWLESSALGARYSSGRSVCLHSAVAAGATPLRRIAHCADAGPAAVLRFEKCAQPHL